MKSRVLKTIVLCAALLAGCAGADNACLDSDPACFTHTQGQDSGSSTQSDQAGNANAADTSAVGTITKTLVVDDFADPNAFTAGNNSLSPAQKQSDDHTMSVYALASGDRMELQCATSGCYWYTLLAGQGSCLDVSQYTHIALTVQGASGAGMTLTLQNSSADCNSTSFTGAQSVNLGNYTVFDNNPHGLLVPLSAFPTVDKVHSRAITITTLPGNPVYVSNIQFVTVSHTP